MLSSSHQLMTSTMTSMGGATISSSTSTMNESIMSDGMSEPSSPDSSFDTADLLSSGIPEDIAAQLAAAGPAGYAAAAEAIAGMRKKKRPHLYESNPTLRKRQQTRLLRKLKNTIEEYSTRVGQQAIVLCCAPRKLGTHFKAFGSQPLETVMKESSIKDVVVQGLSKELAAQQPTTAANSGLHELPSLTIDGLPTYVDKMTQAQLRTFIPEMLKYSTGRSKPGWGKPHLKPSWWPIDCPWANVRSDVRTEEQKKAVNWTEALRLIVTNCYAYHDRQDLLNTSTPVQNREDPSAAMARTVLQTINNPDGTLSVIQIETGSNQVITLPCGTVIHNIDTVNTSQQEASQAVKTLSQVHAQIPGNKPEAVRLEVNPESLGGSVATINEVGHIIISDPAYGSHAEMMSIPAIPVSLYETQTGLTLSELQQLQASAGYQSELQQLQASGGYQSEFHQFQASGGYEVTVASMSMVSKQEHEEELEISENHTVIEIPELDQTVNLTDKMETS